MTRVRKNTPGNPPQRSDEVAWLDIVTAKVRALRYGMVEIVIHDGRVVQIEQSESFRFDESGALKDPGS